MPERIVDLFWPAKEITGGIKLAFRHVEILREAGLEAVIATPGAERPQWFETTAPMIDVPAIVRGQDVLVFPENHPGMLKSFASWPNRKMVFCQNQFMVRSAGIMVRESRPLQAFQRADTITVAVSPDV